MLRVCAGCLAKLGVGELAELFSFVWVAAATATEADGSNPETQRAVEEAVANAERYVNAAIRKREEERAVAVSRAFELALAGGRPHDAEAAQMTATAAAAGVTLPTDSQLGLAALTAVRDTLREAARALACGIEDMTKCDGIPGPIKAVKLRVQLRSGDTTEATDGEAKDGGAETDSLQRIGLVDAVDRLSSVIQVILTVSLPTHWTAPRCIRTKSFCTDGRRPH